MALRQWLGTACLLTATVLLVLGETAFESMLRGWSYVFYWTACLLFTVLAMLSALFEIRATRHRTREKQKELLREMFSGLNRKPPEDT